MATNLDIITTALGMLNVINENEAPSSELAAKGLEAMNELLADWQEAGIELGYFPQTNLAATSPLEDFHLRGVKANLAVELASRIPALVPDATAFVAQDSKENLTKSTAEIIENSFDHLPRSAQRFDIDVG